MIPPSLQETLAELTDNVRRLTEAVSLLAEAQARVYNTTLSPPGSRIPERCEHGFISREICPMCAPYQKGAEFPYRSNR